MEADLAAADLLVPDLLMRPHLVPDLTPGPPPFAFAPPSYLGPVNIGSNLVAADLNGDGHLDLAVSSQSALANRAGSVLVYLGAGDGTFAAPRALDPGGAVVSVAVGDLNGDGVPDLVGTSYFHDLLAVWLGTGGGDFAAPTTLSIPMPYSVAVGDLNGDGHLDIVAVSSQSAGTVHVFLGKGDGRFGPDMTAGTGPYPSHVTVADLNGDGLPELVLDGNDGTSVLPGKGGGAFGPRTVVSPIVPRSKILARDLNGDGRIDLALAGESPGQVGVLAGQGDGTFAPFVPIYQGTDPYNFDLADLDRDGHLDVIVAEHFHRGCMSAMEHCVRVAAGQADGSFGPPEEFNVLPELDDVVAADFNEDGMPDLALSDLGGGSTVVVLLNRTK